MTRQGVHRRSLARAVKAAWWLDHDQDAAAIRAAGDLADMLDQLRDRRAATMGFGNVVLVAADASKEAWHAASVHAKYLAILEALRMTPATRPEQVSDDTADLISELRRSLQA
jgi:hypothetical protein